ncbi:MAG: endo-1,4-beta-xylanase [Lachnospiraceae bacterium]|jgi:endo-1,4-beta-xylanase|nr:endo-1,4-beta-xylanase [Lachnospiraceae bacterium]
MRKQWLSLGVAGLLMLMSACGKETDQNTGAVPTETVENQDGQVADGGDTKENDGEENVSDGEEKEDSGAEKETDGDTDETENGQEEVPPVEWIVEDKDIGPATSLTPLKDAYAPYFKVGVGLTGYAPHVMMTTSEAMSEVVKYHFNSATLTNLMKPSYLLDQAGSIENAKNGDGMPAVTFDACIDALEFCKENGIGMRGHTLVWHAQVPGWFFREGYEDDAPLVSRETMLSRMESYIAQVIGFTEENYPGVVYCWDVVNEAVEPGGGMHEEETGYCIRTYNGDEENLWYTVVGADYVEKAFTYARKYAPEGVKLFYNDYNTFQPVKNEKICALLADLSAKGLVDGIGMQSYYDRKNPDIKGRTGSVQAAIENFSELGLEIHITELTINIDEPDERAYLVQAMRFKEMFQLLMELDTDNGGPANITSVTVFGLMDEYMLYPDNKEYSRFFDGDLKPKQALTWVLDAAQGK